MTTVVAFDVGGTRLKAGVVVDGAVGEVLSRPTAGLGAGALIALLIDTLADVAAGSVDAVGLAVPGIVDEGRVVALPGKFDGLVGRDLAAEVAASAGAPVFVVNDAIAAGVGEAASGAGAGRRRVVVMTIGTGIGVTVVEDGRPLGAGPWGGGLMGGHVPVMAPDSGAVDSNGARGTIEALCAAPRLLAAAAEAGCDADTVPALLERWGTGDPAARQAVVAYRRNLEQALVALAHAHAPSAIVVGGGPVSTSSDWLLAGMTETVGRRLWSGQDCAIVPAALGDAAALVGVAALAAEV
jgi:glucokinase